MYHYLLLKFNRFSVDKNIHFILAVFFNHERPEDIGISGALGAYSNEVLGSVFGVTMVVKISDRKLSIKDG